MSNRIGLPRPCSCSPAFVCVCGFGIAQLAIDSAKLYSLQQPLQQCMRHGCAKIVNRPGLPS